MSHHYSIASVSLAQKAAPWMTAAYLMFELAFNARLLDVAGGLPDLDNLNGIEFWGRALSGIGASLMLWRLICQRTGRYSFASLVAVISVAGTAVFFGQRELVEYVVQSRTTTELRQAAQVVAASRATLLGEVSIKGLELEPSDYSNPAGKAFFSVLPLLASVNTHMLTRIGDELHRIVNVSVRAEVGEPHMIYKDHYLVIANDVRNELYNKKYLPASNQLSEVRTRGNSVGQDWTKYRGELAQARIDASNPSPAARANVIRHLRRAGIQVSDDFRLDSRSGFEAAHPHIGAELKFRRRVDATLGRPSTINVGLDVIQFTRHADVQAYAKAQLKSRYPAIDLSNGDIDLNASSQQFREYIYEPRVIGEVKRRVVSLTASTQSYAPGGANHESGQRAMKAAVVPALALGFSLLFGLTNLISLVSDRIQSQARVRYLFKASLVAIVLVGPIWATNSVTRSSAYQSLEGALATRSAMGALALRWVVQAEPIFYPVTNTVRKALLGVEFKEMPTQAG